MPISELDLAVARATGESICEVRRRGFSLANPFEVDFDPEPEDRPPSSIDWDELDAQRVILFP